MNHKSLKDSLKNQYKSISLRVKTLMKKPLSRFAMSAIIIALTLLLLGIIFGILNRPIVETIIVDVPSEKISESISNQNEKIASLSNELEEKENELEEKEQSISDRDQKIDLLENKAQKDEEIRKKEKERHTTIEKDKNQKLNQALSSNNDIKRENTQLKEQQKGQNEIEEKLKERNKRLQEKILEL